jgi:hypothetical protein
MRTHFAANGHRVVSLVAEEGGQIVGLGQARQRDGAWHVARLLTMDTDQATSTQIIASLLAALSQAAAERGAARLYAHADRHTASGEAFSRSGFTPYSHESVYCLPQAPASAEGSAQTPLRLQESKDAWGIYQLYCAVTPRVVQQAEDRDASYWELSSAATMRALRQVGDGRWVLEIQGEVNGYVHANRLSRRLEILVHPQAYAHARAMIAHGVRDILPARAICCCLPEYQGELGIALEEEGFRFLGTQIAYVRHLTALVRAEARVVRPILEPKLGTAQTASRSSTRTP